MCQYCFSQNCTNTEIYSSDDIYVIRNLDEGNRNSLPALLQLALVLFLQTLISPCHIYWMPDLRQLRNFCKLSTFSTLNLQEIKQYQVFVAKVELAKSSMHKDCILLAFIKSKIK